MARCMHASRSDSFPAAIATGACLQPLKRCAKFWRLSLLKVCALMGSTNVVHYIMIERVEFIWLYLAQTCSCSSDAPTWRSHLRMRFRIRCPIISSFIDALLSSTPATGRATRRPGARTCGCGSAPRPVPPSAAPCCPGPPPPVRNKSANQIAPELQYVGEVIWLLKCATAPPTAAACCPGPPASVRDPVNLATHKLQRLQKCTPVHLHIVLRLYQPVNAAQVCLHVLETKETQWHI